MTRAEWQEFGKANTNHQLDDSYKSSGSSSLRVENTDTKSAEILEQSLVDKPNKGKLESQIRSGYTVHVYFRFVDKDNYYVTSHDGGDLFLHKVVDEKDQEVAVVNAQNVFNDEFGRFQIKFWIDSGDDLRVRWEYWDQDEWKEVGDDLIDEAPSLTEGGGIGVGGSPLVHGGSNVWFDETKIYYPK